MKKKALILSFCLAATHLASAAYAVQPSDPISLKTVPVIAPVTLAMGYKIPVFNDQKKLPVLGKQKKFPVLQDNKKTSPN